MSQKSALKKRPTPRKAPNKKAASTTVETPVESTEELSSAEQFFEDLKPHLTTIGLVIMAVVLGMIAWSVYQSASFQNEAIKWTDLNQAASINYATGDVKELTRVADDYKDSTTGLIGSLYAADSQMRQGISQLGTDREGALLLVDKARKNYEFVVQADDSLKTEWLNSRALFSLAYACETIGKFNEAKKYYGQLLEVAADSPLADKAQRGLDRCSNPDYVALYDTFKNFQEEVIGDAPGPGGAGADRPSGAISEFSDIELPPGLLPPTKDQKKPDAGADDNSETTGNGNEATDVGGEATGGSSDGAPAGNSEETSKPAESGEPQKNESGGDGGSEG